MHKHSRKQNRNGGRWQNANHRLSESASEAVRTLTGFLDGQGDFASVYLHSEYLSKFCSENLVPADVRRKAAIDKWKKTEEVNAKTNQRLRGMDRGYNILPRVPFYTFLRFAQRIIEDVLGPLTNELVIGSFSGGASTSRRRTEGHPALKFSGQADVTGNCGYALDVLHREVPFFREHSTFYSLREVEGAMLFTVPKKSDIDRCACKEPDINMYLQKGVGRHIKRRLLRFGINLRDQSINRRLARQGSLDGSFATIDLSSASDTITRSCVEALLPRDWFLYLNDIRSQFVKVEGTYVRTEMFSSMGNGFTFELESLIFYALMRTTAYFEGFRGVISVFGDDLIIPSGMYHAASWILEEFGFSLNAEKSFHEGPFRESCGGHYLNGDDVTPFYLKRPATHLTDVIRVANQFRLWALTGGRQYWVPSTYDMWTKLANLVPKNLWGGRDYSLDTQLVTPGAPRKRLVRITKELKVPDLGRYNEWHNSVWDRSFEAENGFDPVRAANRCRLRGATPGAPTYTEEFYEEIFG